MTDLIWPRRRRKHASSNVPDDSASKAESETEAGQKLPLAWKWRSFQERKGPTSCFLLSLPSPPKQSWDSRLALRLENTQYEGEKPSFLTWFWKGHAVCVAVKENLGPQRLTAGKPSAGRRKICCPQSLHTFGLCLLQTPFSQITERLKWYIWELPPLLYVKVLTT